ncbi:VOC family protein [Streptacidiphilus sp. N1-12]|uniref:VOC family protein n=2 Tax=Streptacidiphilus alkalitolerans TaxID=3342712 RepID=A0ABV6VKK1_9ACTN
MSLTARDLGTAERFYGSLLGWDFIPGTQELGPYLRAVVGGLPVAGIGVMEAGTGMPVDWITYFAADSADEAAHRVRANGGTMALGPLDSEKAGRLALAADLDGAVFGIWEAREHPGWALQHQPGAVAWSELATTGARRAGNFYEGVFGSAAVRSDSARVERNQDMVVLTVGGRRVAGIRQVPQLDDRPRWRILFAVGSVDEVAARAPGLGGSVEQPPADTPYGRTALLRDPEGGPFGIVRMS